MKQLTVGSRWLSGWQSAILTAILLSLSGEIAFTQAARDTGKYAYSLQQALDFAMKNQVQLQNALYDEQAARYKVNETVGIGLPQLNASGSINDYLEIPTSVIPARAFDPKAPSDLFIPVKFGMPYSSTVGVTASQLLFNSDYLVGLQSSRTFLDLSRKNTARTKIDVSVAVTKAYYSALISNERMKLVDANLESIKMLMKDTKAMNENGVAEKIDVDRITVTYNNLLVQKDNIRRLQQLSIAMLKFQMGMDQMATLTLTDDLINTTFAPEISAEKFEYGKRIEYSLLQTQKNVSLLLLKQNRMRYLPTAALFGNASANAFRNKFDFFDTKLGWYPTIIIGIQANVGLFDGLQTHYRIQQAKINVLKADANLKMMQQSIDLEIENARAGLQNAAATLATQRNNMTLAESVYNTAKIKYEQGVGSNLEVTTAQTSLTEAQTNYYNALFEALVAKIDYDKATGMIK